MSIANPIPASIRRHDFMTLAGQTVFGPANFLVLSVGDVRISRLNPATGNFDQITSGYTVTMSSPVLGFPTVTLDAALPTNTLLRIEGARLHARLTDVTRAGSLATAALERELDTQSYVLQELRRDVSTVSGVSEAHQLRLNAAEALALAQAGTLAGHTATLADHEARIVTAAQALAAANTAVQAAIDAKAAAQTNIPQIAFSSRAVAQAADIPATIQVLELRSYYEDGLGTGRGIFKRVWSAPVPAQSGFRSADRRLPDGSTDPVNGGYFQLCLPDDGFVTPEMLGCPRAWSGVVYDTQFIQAAIDFSKGRVRFTSNADRNYYVNAEITCLYPNAVLISEGANIHCWLIVMGNYGKTMTLGNEVIAAGSAVVRGLRYYRPNTGHWLKTGTNITGIARGASTVISSTAHGLAAGDIFFVKGSGTQADGQRFKVAPSPSANAVGVLTEAGANVDSSGWTAWASGGTIHKVQTGYDDNVVGLDDPIADPTDSWHLRLYNSTFAVIDNCHFTGHGRQLWFDGCSYPLIVRPDFNGFWDEERPDIRETEASIYFSPAAFEALPIAGITQANPGRVTISGHNFKNGDRVYAYGIGGMTALNDRFFTVHNVIGNSFDLKDHPGGFAIDTSALPAWTSGGSMRKMAPGATNGLLQTLPMIVMAMMEGTGITPSVGFGLPKTPLKPITVGNATVNQREDIGPKFGILARSCEGFHFLGGIIGSQNRSSFCFDPLPFAVPNAVLTGHVIVSDVFVDGARHATFEFKPGDGLMFAVTIRGCQCNGGDVCDHIVDIQNVSGRPTVTRFVFEGNVSQGHRKAPLLLRGVHAGAITGNVLGAWNVLGNTNGDTTTDAGIYLHPSTHGVNISGNTLGGSINDPYAGYTFHPTDKTLDVPGGNFCKWAIFDAASSNSRNAHGRNLAINLGLAGGGLANTSPTL